MPKPVLLLRPYSWIKNIFIFVPLFFARDFFVYTKFINVVLAFIVFCITASSVYILNDIFDREQDRKHETKKNRPIASGAVSVKFSLYLLFCLLAIDAGLIYFFIPQIFWLMGIYFILNILYSAYLKRVAVLEMLIVSSFYFIRIMVGGIAAQAPISRWLFICITLISLLLVLGKRLAEFGQENRRSVLLQYNKGFLSRASIIVAFLVVISYSLYSIFVLGSNLEIFSIFLVSIGVMRYLFLVFTTHKAEYPEKVLIADKIIFATSAVWAIVVYFIIYLNV